LDNNWSRTRVFDDIRVADPIGRRHDDFVAGLNEYADDVEDRMLAADVCYALFRFVIRTEFALVPGANCVAKGHHTGSWRVLSLIFVNRFDRGLLDVVGRREVWLARTKVCDVHALSFQLICSSDDGCGWRDLYAIDAIR